MTSTKLNILKIDSSARKTGSVSRQLTERLVERIASETEVSVVERDVAKGLPSVTEDWIGSNYTPKGDRNGEQVAKLELSDELISELHAADVLVIGMPIYNFGMPAALKAWVDLVCRVGETFQYSENGPIGLLANKRAIVTVASGGVPVGSPVDHATTYLTQVLNFIGITDVTYVSATDTAMNLEASVKSAEDEIDSLDLAQLQAA